MKKTATTKHAQYNPDYTFKKGLSDFVALTVTIATTYGLAYILASLAQRV